MSCLNCAQTPLSARVAMLTVFTREPPGHLNCSSRVASHARSSFAQTREGVPSFAIEVHSSQCHFELILRCVSHYTPDLSTPQF